MKAFLEDIATRLVEKYPENMDKMAVVLPSKRAVVFLKHYLSKKIKKPIFLPQFFSVEEFVESVSGLKVVDNISLQFYLYQSSFKNLPKKSESFDEFLNWSNILLHDFNEVDRNMVDAKAIFSNLKEVKELENWSVKDWSLSSEKLTESQQNFVDFYANFYLWYRQFNNMLLAKGLAYQGMAYRKAVEDISKVNLKWEKVWFVGLNALTKSEQQIIEYLKQKDIARVFWDADNYYLKNKNQEAGSFLRKQKDKWKEINFEVIGDYFTKPKRNFNIVACPKNIAQAKVGAEVIKHLSDEDLKQSNTAIVLADESLLYPVLNNLPTNVRELNVTMGSPLKNTPFYSLIESLFAMQLRAFEYKKSAFYFKDVLLFISHPLLKKIINPDYISELRLKITSKNKVFIEPKLIEKHFKEDYKILISILSVWNDVTPAISAVQELTSIFRETLVGKKGTIDSEVLFAFNKSFNLLKSLITENNFSIEIKTLNSILNQLIAKEVIPFQGEPLKGIQLMGILESRTLDFKNVILMSVNEGCLPKGKSVNSFIPFDVKVYFEMPTYRENDAVYAYHFYRLLQRAENITILYNTQTDDFGSGEKSRFITQLLAEFPYYNNGEINHLVFSGDKLKFVDKTIISVENKGLEKQIESWATYVSPSALNMYNNCSLSFYYKYLAKIKKVEEVEEFTEASTVGSAIHDAFQETYPLGNITPKQIDDLKSEMIKSVETKFIEKSDGESYKEGKNYLSLEIAKKITEDFLDFEKKYLSNSLKSNISLNILESEKEHEFKLKVNNLEFNIKGKVDRVDTLGDTLRIIDYKTGQISKTDVAFYQWDDICDKPSKAKAFQLLVYAYLYLKKNPQYLDKKVLAGDFSFKNLKDGLLTVSKYDGKKRNTLFINKEVMGEIENQLVNVINKILTNNFIQAEDEKACDWCDYKAICNR
ncbi:MAG: PD-(D/E)XK nuclease family protein [Flavobacteriales bacterium]|nr:PD-(D/E)XK nuclease family protein [Flavobacteriales bacterium]